MWYGIIIKENNGHKEIKKFEKRKAFNADVDAIFYKNTGLFSTEEARENFISKQSDKLANAALA